MNPRGLPAAPRIKICGLSRPEDIAAVNREKPDYCGFIINFPKSRRNISVEQLKALTALLDPAITAVGVFVDQPPRLIADLLNDGTIHTAQLHGAEDEAYLAELRRLTGHPVWQAFQIRSKADVQKAAASTADLVLLDAGQGSGRTFAWDLIRDFPRPFALAGGLNAENLAEALGTGAALLDISGGAETDGKKDPDKIRSLVTLFRGLASGQA